MGSPKCSSYDVPKTLRLRLVCHRTDIHLWIDRVPDLDVLRKFHKLVSDLVVNIRVDVYPLHLDAHLACRCGRPEQDTPMDKRCAASACASPQASAPNLQMVRYKGSNDVMRTRTHFAISLGSTSSSTMQGSFPPSSSVTLLRLSAALRITALPAVVDPVIEICEIRGCLTIHSPLEQL